MTIQKDSHARFSVSLMLTACLITYIKFQMVCGLIVFINCPEPQLLELIVMNKKITILLLIAFFVTSILLNSCNQNLSNNTKPLKAPNKKTASQVEPKIQTEDILDENGKKLFKVTIEKVGNTHTPFRNHFSFLLDNGKVLIWQVFGIAEIYDPVSKQFEQVSDKLYYNLSFIDNNLVYFEPTLLYDTNKNKIIESIDDKSHKKLDKFLKLYKEHKNTKMFKKYGLGQSLLNQKYVQICRNYQDTYVSLCLHYLKDFKYTKPGKLNIPKMLPNFITLQDGNILIIGGYVETKKGVEKALSSIEMYNPQTGKVSEIGNMIYPRIGPSSIKLQNGKILITGGYRYIQKGKYDELKYYNNAELFDLNTGKSLLVGEYEQSYHEKSNNHYQLAILKDGNAILLGTHLNIFDSKTNRFYSMNLPDGSKRYLHSLTVLKDGKVLIVGGYEIRKYTTKPKRLQTAELITIEEYNDN